MTRVAGAGSHRAAHARSTLDRPRPARKQKEYKVVLEAVTEKKRKLHRILTFQDQAPPGFGFIPVGFGEVTEWCKEQCRQRGRGVHVVSARPKGGNHIRADPERISSHVHRIGHHFPSDIIELACSKFGYRFSPVKGLEKVQTQSYGVEYFERRLAEYYERQQVNGHNSAETEKYISGAVRELFPKIPDADLSSIVNHAFKEGTERVGNAKELSLARRVQLAVVAHIRHNYTDYDNLLKSGSWLEARAKAELPSLAKLKEWRGETDQSDSNELEETFREIIVIDDEDDSGDESPVDHSVDERELSMEIVSSHATARDLQPEAVPRHQEYAQHVGRMPRRTIFLQSRPPAPRPVYSYPAPPVTYVAPQAYQAGPPRIETRPPPPPLHFRPEPFQASHSRPLDSSMREPSRAPRITEMRGADGQLYILEPIDEPRYVHERDMNYSRMLPIEVEPYGRPIVASGVKRPAPDETIRESKSRRTSEQDLVLPSVESEAAHSPRHDHQERMHGAPGYAPFSHAPPAYGHRQHVPEYVNAHRQPRMQPQFEVIDLTSSPRRTVAVQKDPRMPLSRSNSGFSNHYVLAPPRPSPPRDARGVLHDYPQRTHAPYDRAYDDGYIPSLDTRALKEEARRFQVEGGRFLRSGLEYSGTYAPR